MRLTGRTPAVSAVLVFALLLGTVFLVRREEYLLNRAVRLLCERIIQFEHLSMVRRETYKFTVHPRGYEVLLFQKDKGGWIVFDRHTYPSNIVSSAENLEIFLAGGGMEKCLVDGKALEENSFTILYFFHRKDPEKRKSMIFYERGGWRVLE